MKRLLASRIFSFTIFFGLAVLAVSTLGGCGGASSTGGAGAPLTVGFLYVGPKDDYGYSQAHHQGEEAVKALPGVKCVEQEKVPETDQVQKAMKSMIEQEGATVIFPTSYGYFDPHTIEVAKQYPNITFLHCGGVYDEKKHTPNITTYFGYIDECEYLAGIVAGYATKKKKLGFIAAKPIPQVRRNINAFTLGARSVDPAITTTVIFTGDWSDQVKEVNAATSLINQAGVDVLTCHVDSPKAIMQKAEEAGIMCCGYHASQAILAPKGYLTGSEWNWEGVYVDFVKKMQKGEKLAHSVRGGLKEGFVKTSPYGPLASEEAKKKADEVKAEFMKGTFVIFKGPIKDNKGNIVIPEGKSYGQTAPELESMDYFVEGVKTQD